MSLPIKYIAIGLLFLVHLILGYWVTRSGKPYHTAILTIHKLVSLAALVMIVLTIKQLWTDARVGGLGIAAIVVTLNSNF